MLRKLLLPAGLLLALTSPARAQLTVTPLRDLAFGWVVPNVAKHILPSDPVRSAQWEFLVPIGSQVRLQFSLPNRLNSGNNRLNISFGASDGIATGTAPSSVPVTFDPRTAQTFNIVTSDRIWVFLGGTVSPTRNQRAGVYRNTVTLIVTVL